MALWMRKDKYTFRITLRSLDGAELIFGHWWKSRKSSCSKLGLSVCNLASFLLLLTGNKVDRFLFVLLCAVVKYLAT